MVCSNSKDTIVIKIIMDKNKLKSNQKTSIWNKEEKLGKASPESILKHYLNCSNTLMILSDRRERISLFHPKIKPRSET